MFFVWFGFYVGCWLVMGGVVIVVVSVIFVLLFWGGWVEFWFI